MSRILPDQLVLVPAFHDHVHSRELNEMSRSSCRRARTAAALRARRSAAGRRTLDCSIDGCSTQVFKFQTLSPRYEARLKAASPKAIERYLQRLLTADSIEAVFED